MDKIMVERIQAELTVGWDAWQRRKCQPVLLSVTISTDLHEAGAEDRLAKSIHYGTVAKRIREQVTQTREFDSIAQLACCVLHCIQQQNVPLGKVEVLVELPKALLHASRVSLKANPGGSTLSERIQTSWSIENLRISTILGVNPHERIQKQPVLVSVEMSGGIYGNGNAPQALRYHPMVSQVIAWAEQTKFLTVEAFAHQIAYVVFQRLPPEPCIDTVTVRVRKLGALTFAASAGVQVLRSREDFPELLAACQDLQETYTTSGHVLLALGSNLGNRSQNIHRAIEELVRDPGFSCTLVDTSFLYESKPVHVENQPRFLNAVIQITTKLTPLELLQHCKRIEAKLGRQERERNGPREIDLDVLCFGNQVLATTKLTLPHPAMHEREFVLRPLCEYVPHTLFLSPVYPTSGSIVPEFVHPILGRTAKDLLALQLVHQKGVSQLQQVMPIPGSEKVLYWNQQTFCMGILNASVESFSGDAKSLYTPDGTLDYAHLDRYMEVALRAKVHIVDVGGASSKPNADPISESTELKRVLDVLKHLEVHLKRAQVPLLSVDTTRANVARHAVQHGVSIINDVSGGLEDDKMLATVASLQTPYILVHRRGTPQTMMHCKTYEHDGSGGVVQAVVDELAERIQAALHVGIFRWNLLLDPGIGFAKGTRENLEILRSLSQLRQLPTTRLSSGDTIMPHISSLRGFPVVVGTSRKGFIGQVLDQEEPSERRWGTAATCALAVAGGANILRVHDMEEMSQVLRMSDAILQDLHTAVYSKDKQQ